MPVTARKHFGEDMKRARELLLLAQREAPSDAERASDLARSSVVFAVGALDAYLCDAFVDVLARTMHTCRTNRKRLPGGYARLSLPAGPLFSVGYTARHNWALRMAARKMMEKDNLLRLSRLEELFNPALASGQKLWIEMIDAYIKLDRRRLTNRVVKDLAVPTGTSAAVAKTMLDAVRKEAKAALLERLGKIIQRRHDIAHNCDRPKTAYQAMSPASAKKMVADVAAFVDVLDRHLDAHLTC
jgi:hypothetical protein